MFIVLRAEKTKEGMMLDSSSLGGGQGRGGVVSYSRGHARKLIRKAVNDDDRR